ncbi:uncharacterized protein LOC123009830 isoform X2 [Tribolium madens]|uniref:uncharacterized protein LOC123009830 isoform X2 n=1 Tax=Tribolium madens TaxID=41895 RepID=UPI001CF76070|nr:uncharacterized protein LOC123009830 isoform X2 [Tribolium madens]
MDKPKLDSRKTSIIILSVTVTFILAIVITGVCVRFLLEGKVQQVILIILICTLITVGMTSLIVLEVRRRRVRRIKKAKRANYISAPTAPPMVDSSTWKYSKNYSQRTTVQA